MMSLSSILKANLAAASKTAAEKAPAARDVAGIIRRSIDYSATAALGTTLKPAPDEQGKIARARSTAGASARSPRSLRSLTGTH